MGTSNYHYENVLYTNDNDEQDEWLWEDIRSNVVSELASNKGFYEDDSINIDTELRSFGATSIGSITKNLHYLDLDIEINFTLCTRSGYYQGFNLDYEININSNYYNFDNVSEYLDDIEEFEETEYIGLFKAHRDSLKAKLNELVLDTHNEICDVYEMFSDKSEVIARFSNGETIYTKG